MNHINQKPVTRHGFECKKGINYYQVFAGSLYSFHIGQTGYLLYLLME